MKIFIFANCQGTAIGKLLQHAGFTNIHNEHNYHYITHTSLNNTIENHLKTCDFFIYQPLSAIYPVYNTNNLKSYLKPGCITISFPYMYNDALVPLYISYRRDIPNNGEYAIDGNDIKYGNINVIHRLKDEGYSLESILDLYDTDQIDWNYEERFNNTLHILRDKEKETDIKISDFILKNHKDMPLFNYHYDARFICCNHPCNNILIECTNQILDILNTPRINYSGDELIPGRYNPSRYDIKYYNFKWISNESIHINIYYRNLIIEMYNI